MTDGKHRGASHSGARTSLPWDPEGVPGTGRSHPASLRVAGGEGGPGVYLSGSQCRAGAIHTGDESHCVACPDTARRRGLLLQAHDSCT